MTLLELAAKVEAADAGQHTLDYLIAKAIGWQEAHTGEGPGHEWWIDPSGGGQPRIPHYSGSLDSALTLLVEGFEWELLAYDAARDPRFGRFQARIKLLSYADDPEELGPEAISNGATPALALTAAALRARSSLNQAEGV